MVAQLTEREGSIFDDFVVCFNASRFFDIWIITDHYSPFCSCFYHRFSMGAQTGVFWSKHRICSQFLCLHRVVSESMICFPFGWKQNMKHTQKRLTLRLHKMHSNYLFNTWNKSRYHGNKNSGQNKQINKQQTVWYQDPSVNHYILQILSSQSSHVGDIVNFSYS